MTQQTTTQPAAREDHESHEDAALHPACTHCNPPAPKPIGRCVQVPCPCCGEPQANVTVALNLLGSDDEPAFTCTECGNEFTVATVRNVIAKWTPLLRWLDSVPDLDAE